MQPLCCALLCAVLCLQVDELLAAVLGGTYSSLLGAVHIQLMRVIQADMEEAHATGAQTVRRPPRTPSALT